jgi:hypothetical protein
MKKTIIKFAINTIEDLKSNDKHIEEFFLLLINLIKDGHEIEICRIGSDERLTLIKDLGHLDNFKYSFGFIQR